MNQAPVGSVPSSNVKFVKPPVPARYLGKVVLNKPKGIKEKVIALTFDDGPSPWTTVPILDSLKKNNAKATFFVVGVMVPKREEILRRMLREGHTIGNHTNTHPMRPSAGVGKPEIEIADAKIKKAIGYTPNIFRPPYGLWRNSTAVYSRRMGVPSIQWTGTSADTARHASVQSVINNTMHYVAPGGIILLHDVKPHTAKAVPAILARLKKMGYRCVTVHEMLEIWDRQFAANEAATAAKRSLKPGKA
jgi:peptidoglycan/xylan/chitin deacetylase (PgdA/CDA1 family)